jgi:two-component sensor histidine kinase
MCQQHIELTIIFLIYGPLKGSLCARRERKMSIQIAYGNVGVAEADHRIANNLANLSGVIRLQRNAISRSGRTFTTEQVCMLLDDIDARIEVTAKLHKSLARAVNGNGVNLGDFVEEISEMISALGPEGRMNLTVDNSRAMVTSTRVTHFTRGSLPPSFLQTPVSMRIRRAYP